MDNNDVHYIASAVIYKKYKYSNRWKGKVVTVTRDGVSSVILDDVFHNKDDAVENAKIHIQRLKDKEL